MGRQHRMKTIDVLSSAIRDKHICAIQVRGEKSERIVEPHIVYEASNGNLLLDFWQTDGYSSSGNLPSWKRLIIADIIGVKITGNHFQTRQKEGYNPSNKKRYSRTICCVEL
jgi:hypothetical protein